MWQHLNHRDTRRIEEEEEIESLFEKIMKENFPNLVKEIDRKSKKHRESQTNWTQIGPHQVT